MATRQLSLKRNVYDLKKGGFEKMILSDTKCRMLFYNYLIPMVVPQEGELSDIDFEICCVAFILLWVKNMKKEGVRAMGCPIYTFLAQGVLPEMWRSRKGIELKRQRKLEDLANLLDNDERYQEAHVIRIIVKPYLEEMNRGWTNMTAMGKFKSLIS